ncbi:50S ribosomal protein L24e [Candidatus Micrarchaeota archaeon]|nr:50S ribosomal protein L24e [Candidatus Micrarchaeota archaeon]
MAVCSFCGKEIQVGFGLTFFKKDGSATRWCSKKCEKNALMKRNPVNLKWTERFKKK